MVLSGCITQPVLKDCCWHGICFECALAYDHQDIDLVKSVILGHWLTAICLWCITFYNLHCWYVESRAYYNQQALLQEEYILEKPEKEKKSAKQNTNAVAPAPPSAQIADQVNKQTYRLDYPWFRLIHIWYPFVTGCFAISRVEYELGKPLLIFAALHNLGEWAMITYAYFGNQNNRHRYFIIFMIWIWFVISCIVVIPKFPIYALVEQVSGIALDFLLPLTWFLLMYQMDNPLDSQMYKIAFLAHLVHLLGTIIPLVIENFIVGQSYYVSIVMEFLIFFSTASSHALYSTFTSIFQTRVVSKYDRNFPDKYVLKNKLWKYLIICAIVGLIPTAIIPAIVGVCPIDNTNTHRNLSEVYLNATKFSFDNATSCMHN